ncbi:hypothetical protein L1275_001295 [Flavobacterium sp. HSC-61S13]|nr:hypothetical protein [Flavobacterium sp. HSC-61S13]
MISYSQIAYLCQKITLYLTLIIKNHEKIHIRTLYKNFWN